MSETTQQCPSCGGGGKFWSSLNGRRCAVWCSVCMGTGEASGDNVQHFYPQDGSVYRHYKGGLYRVLMVVRREGSAEQMVVYQPQDGTIPWVRPLTEFAEKFSCVSNTGWEPT